MPYKPHRADRHLSVSDNLSICLFLTALDADWSFEACSGGIAYGSDRVKLVGTHNRAASHRQGLSRFAKSNSSIQLGLRTISQNSYISPPPPPPSSHSVCLLGIKSCTLVWLQGQPNRTTTRYTWPLCYCAFVSCQISFEAFGPLT